MFPLKTPKLKVPGTLGWGYKSDRYCQIASRDFYVRSNLAYVRSNLARPQKSPAKHTGFVRRIRLPL